MRKLFAVFAAAGLVAAAAPATAVLLPSSAALPVPKVDPALAAALSAPPASALTAYVHGTDVDVAAASARRAGLDVVDTLDRVGVVIAAGTVAEVASLKGVRGL